jgi:hypothetical protein
MINPRNKIFSLLSIRQDGTFIISDATDAGAAPRTAQQIQLGTQRRKESQNKDVITPGSGTAVTTRHEYFK